VQLAIAGRRHAVHGPGAEHVAEHLEDRGLLTAVAIAMAHEPLTDGRPAWPAPRTVARRRRAVRSVTVDHPEVRIQSTPEVSIISAEPR
jgi:hypothetical protein